VAEPKSRRRGEELEQAILDAVWAELREVGYSRLTIEAVAVRAGTSKPVIYRRWSSRAELVLAAWNRRMPRNRSVPDTGALRSDLRTLFGWLARRVDAMMSEMIAGVMGEAFRHPEVAELLRERLRASPLTEVVRTILERAIDRGEIEPVELTPRITRLPLDLIRNECMTFGSPVEEETITELVDQIYLPLLHGLAAARPDARPADLGRSDRSRAAG
jgi:AcrR family transcriptional regulator